MTTYVRKPFLVDAVEITDENISELAGFVGALQISRVMGRSTWM